jgi:hypothetical protein
MCTNLQPSASSAFTAATFSSSATVICLISARGPALGLSLGTVIDSIKGGRGLSIVIQWVGRARYTRRTTPVHSTLNPDVVQIFTAVNHPPVNSDFGSHRKAVTSKVLGNGIIQAHPAPVKESHGYRDNFSKVFEKN